MFGLLGIFRVRDMYSHVNERSGLAAPLIADDVFEIIMKVCYMIPQSYDGNCDLKLSHLLLNCVSFG